MKTQTKAQIAVFASGSGTNTQSIINYFRNTNTANIACIISNNKESYVLQRAKNENIDFLVIDHDNFINSEGIISYFEQKKVDFIVLAGFLWLIPKFLIDKFEKRIINIHPALLPKYGGKGMYGMRVHKAVFDNKEEETGITIHYVNEKYDEGNIIFQAKTKISTADTPEIIAQKVHKLEYEHYPKIIEKLVLSL